MGDGTKLDILSPSLSVDPDKMSYACCCGEVLSNGAKRSVFGVRNRCCNNFAVASPDCVMWSVTRRFPLFLMFYCVRC